MNGRQMADAARVTRAPLNVLFITGHAENALLKDGQLEPGRSVPTKPFAVDTHIARTRKRIVRRADGPADESTPGSGRLS